MARAPEIHHFLVWEHGRVHAERIVADIARRFEVLAGYEVEWSTDGEPRHFSRLYGQSLPPGSDKVAECGLGPFLLLVVRDPDPHYGRRRKWERTIVTNTALFDAKARYRKWAGASSIHNSSDEWEADRDLFVLLGRRSADFASLPAGRWDGSFEPVACDPVGTGGWRSLSELLTAAELTLPYVVLPTLDAGPDHVRLLVEAAMDGWGVEWLLAEPDDVPLAERGPEYAVTLAGRPAVLELRHVGDGSMPSAWQERFLADRVRDGCAFVLPPEHRLTVLLHDAQRVGRDLPATVLGRLREAAGEAGAHDADLSDPVDRAALLERLAPAPAPAPAPAGRPPSAASNGVRMVLRRLLTR